ncbi:hypothetical protein P5673_000780 [Acropora cervicornis]|uniref:Uncharacterized protein n=1 Tax=Acropora cervicornis TaxID=6130 RepID=A0AAD9VHC4_ACRCE|nr:hypothetical protein P5673_000780 [Acropora cervicornis]
MTPLSTLPVTTVPRPAMEKTSSIGRRNGLSRSLAGVGIYSSTDSKSLMIESRPISGFLPSKAQRAEPTMMVCKGILSVKSSGGTSRIGLFSHRKFSYKFHLQTGRSRWPYQTNRCEEGRRLVD